MDRKPKRLSQKQLQKISERKKSERDKTGEITYSKMIKIKGRATDLNPDRSNSEPAGERTSEAEVRTENDSELLNFTQMVETLGKDEKRNKNRGALPSSVLTSKMYTPDHANIVGVSKSIKDAKNGLNKLHVKYPILNQNLARIIVSVQNPEWKQYMFPGTFQRSREDYMQTFKLKWAEKIQKLPVETLNKIVSSDALNIQPI